MMTHTNVYRSNIIPEAYTKFLKILQTHPDSATHEKPLPRKRNVILKPWITKDLLKRIKLKNKLSLKFQKHPNNLSLKNRYKNLASAIKRDIPLARDNFYRYKFENCSHDIKKQWNVLNEITNKTVHNNNSITLILNGATYSDRSVVANKFNDYFSSMSSSLNLQHPECDCTHIVDLIDDLSPNSFVFHPISALEVIKVIKSLNNSHSCGFNSISNKVLKNVAYNVADVLAYLFNLSVCSGVVPAELKMAIVIPLFNKGDRQVIENYRPISLLPVIAKVFEKSIKKRMISFLAQTNFLSPN